MLYSKLLSAGVCWMLAIQPALAYPTAGNTPCEPGENYGKPYPEKASMSYGDVVFGTDYPDELTEAERYIVCGCDPELSAKMHQSMISELFMMLTSYHRVHQRLPDVVTKEVIDEAARALGREQARELDYEMLRSPLTGSFPALNVKDEFSRGDFYVKVLDAEELEAVARHLPELKALLQGKDPDRRDGGGSAELITPVFYIRAYGESEVIYADLKYGWTQSTD